MAVLSTGDEVVPIDADARAGEVRDVNSTTLSAMVERAGGVPRPLGIVGDDFDSLLAACRAALADADTVLLSGGSSVGSRDLTLEVLEALPDSRVLLHGVAIKPGKPTILADVGGKPSGDCRVTSRRRWWSSTSWSGLARRIGGVRGRHPVSGYRRASIATSPPSTAVGSRAGPARGGTVATGAIPVLGKSGLIRTMVEAEGLLEIDRDVEGLDRGQRSWSTCGEVAVKSKRNVYLG